MSAQNLRTARHELPGYGELIDYWLDERYTLRFCGGLVPDICQQFSKGQGVLTNPPGGSTAPAKLRLAFEAAPFGLPLRNPLHVAPPASPETRADVRAL